MKKAIDFFGLEYGSDLFPEGTTAAHLGTPAAPVFDAAVEAYCAEHTAAEVDEAMGRIGVPLFGDHVVSDDGEPSPLPGAQHLDRMGDRGREDGQGLHGRAPLQEQPAADMARMPSQGMDNEDVLADIGIVDEKRIESLYEKGILRKSDYVGGL